MKLFAALFITALAVCKPIEMGKIPFTVEIPDDWDLLSKENRKNNSTIFYANSPNRFRYEMAMIHQEYVLISVKKNTKSYNGIRTEEDRKKMINNLVKAHKKVKDSHLVEHLGTNQQEKNGLQIISFASTIPAYGERFLQAVYHVISEDYTLLLHCSALIDEEIESKQELFREILRSVKHL